MLKRNSGYTLVELLISLGIFSVVIGSLFIILISHNNLFSRASGRMDVSARAQQLAEGHGGRARMGDGG